MQSTVLHQDFTSEALQRLHTENHDLRNQLANSQQQIVSLQQQLDWFKRQLFGRKSEKRLIESPDQLDISQLFDQPPQTDHPAPDTEQITYTRK